MEDKMIEESSPLKVHNADLYLTKKLRNILDIEDMDKIIIIKGPKLKCPNCQKISKLPGGQIIIFSER